MDTLKFKVYEGMLKFLILYPEIITLRGYPDVLTLRGYAKLLPNQEFLSKNNIDFWSDFEKEIRPRNF